MTKRISVGKGWIDVKNTTYIKLRNIAKRQGISERKALAKLIQNGYDRESKEIFTKPFTFVPTVENRYQFELHNTFMINFGSANWKDRQKPVVTDTPFILDSGGFSELYKHGEYSFSTDYYLDKVENVIQPDVFATMDYMCEDSRLDATGLDVIGHIRNTVENAKEIWDKYDGERKLMPVVQGKEPKDFKKCLHLFEENDIPLDYLGIGTICRRDQVNEIEPIIDMVNEHSPKKAHIHAFGIKKESMKHYGIVSQIDSADSFAWAHKSESLDEIGGKNRRWVAKAWAENVQRIAMETLFLDEL